jgi:hypothetical protein
MNWKEALKKHADSGRDFSLRDLQIYLADPNDLREFATFVRTNRHKQLKEFGQTSNDWQAFGVPAIMSAISRYGQLPDLPQGLVTEVSETTDSVQRRFVWKSEEEEEIQDYLQGEEFRETYIEGITDFIRWRKPGAKLTQTREAAMDLTFDAMATNAELTLNGFKAREHRHFSHELHKGTSNLFPAKATNKRGEEIVIKWRETFDNAFDASQDPYEFSTWTNIKDGRAKMLRRERDAVRPNVCILNASTEAELGDTLGVNNAAFLGNTDTFFRTGSLPNIYQLTFYVIPDALHGYFTSDVTRKTNTFVLTNDIFLATTNNGPTMMRHTREPLSTESWKIYDGQKEAMTIWERYEYALFRHTNVMRIIKGNVAGGFLN